MKWTVLPFVLFAIGLSLLGTSLLWPMLVGKKTVWNAEQAKEFDRAGTSLHHLHHEYQMAAGAGNANQTGHGHNHPSNRSPEELAQLKAEYEQTMQDFAQSRSALERARNWRSVPVRVLRWSGIVVLSLGIAAVYLLRTEWAQQFIDQ